MNPAIARVLTEKVLSEYETNLTGKMVEEEWADKLRETWWNSPNTHLGCLGLFEICSVNLQKEDGKGWKVRVCGKKDSPLVAGLMEFLTFYLMA